MLSFTFLIPIYPLDPLNITTAIAKALKRLTKLDSLRL